jgi:UDP-N-acetylglucosamine 2-epimerase (non-hydrolysing)
VRARFQVREHDYAVLTLHRPSNVDDPAVFSSILDAIDVVASRMPVVFPAHPRTRRRIAEHGLEPRVSGLVVCEPLGYLDFLSLVAHARIVLTDSGGLQEETTVLGIPCLTLRENTERPVTVTCGTNRVVGTATQAIVSGLDAALAANPTDRRPEFWDGRTAQRIAAVVRDFFSA